MNNTITEIKNTLQGINRIIEVEEWISELEDRMVEIREEQNKGKRTKSIKDSLRDLWWNIKHTNLLITVVPEKEEKKWFEKIFEETVARNIPNKGNGQSSPRSTESPIQVKLKEKHAKTHIIKPTKIKHKETALC